MEARKVAVWKLQNLLEKHKNGLPIKTIYAKLVKPYGLTRRELKSARKEIAAVSETVNGMTYWRFT